MRDRETACGYHSGGCIDDEPEQVSISYSSDGSQEAIDYGNGDGEPGAPTQAHSSMETASTYGYATTEIDYGYGDGAPDEPQQKSSPNDSANMYGYGIDNYPSSSQPAARVPRRSSLKGGSGAPRRVSIGYTGEVLQVKLPDHTVVKRRRSITFNDKTEVKEVERVTSLMKDGGRDGDDDDEEKISKIWFRGKEFSEIRDRARTIVDFAQSYGGSLPQGKLACTRGLERHLDPDTYEERRHMAEYSVLTEQHLQREIGMHCDEMIGRKYSFTTLESRELAHSLAEQDYNEIKEDLKMTRKMMRRCSM